jgi:hypothetical protein
MEPITRRSMSVRNAIIRMTLMNRISAITPATPGTMPPGLLISPMMP